MAMSGSIGLSSGFAQNQMQQALGAPRPLGFVERSVGLATGLESLEHRIASLVSRIDGDNEKAYSNVVTSAPPPPGLSSQLSDAESRLRTCMSLIDELHNRF